MPVQGYDAYLVHQFGRQTAINTPVAATRRLPFSGPIVIDPQWQDPDVSTGSLDPTLAPSKRGTEVSGTWETDHLNYTDAAVIHAGGLKGGTSAVAITSGGEWDIQPSSIAVDPFLYITDEWYDDVTTDTVRAYGGVINEYTITYPDDLGPLQLSANLMFAGADVGSPTTPTAPTAGLVVDTIPPYIYAADTAVKIDNTAGTIGSTQLTDAFHGGSIHVTTELEKKRFANGSNNRFVVAGYGRVSRTIDVEMRFAKTSAVLAEVALWLAATAGTPTKRFVDLHTISPVMVSGSLPFYHRLSLPGHWMTRQDDKIGGNDIIVLSLRAKYDTTLTYPIRYQGRNSYNATL